MNMKSFFFGLVAGVVLTLAALFVIGLANQNAEAVDPIKYLEKPESYENKKESSFKILQVLGNAALANEASDKVGGDVVYYGNTVLILGENFYSDQVVRIKKPMIIGTYSYTTNSGLPKTVPVIGASNIE